MAVDMRGTEVLTYACVSAAAIWLCLRKLLRDTVQRPLVVGGHSAKMKAILERVPFLWSCPHLGVSSVFQLFVYALQMLWQEAKFTSQYDFEVERFKVTLPGESTEGFEDTVRVKWLKGRKGDSQQELPHDAPLVILTPGLNCYAANLPGTAVYTELLKQPWRVGVYEKRGVGEPGSSQLQAPVFHMFGHPSDLHVVIQQLVARWPNAPIHLVGMSSGNGLTTGYLALHGADVPNLRSCLCLLGGDDYNCAFAPQGGNWLTRIVFDNALLAASKERMLERNAHVLRRQNAKAYDAALNATSMQDFYDICMEHFSGYTNREEAERRINPFSVGNNECMLSFHVPYLVCFCEDDPVAPGGPRKSWVDLIDKCQSVALAMYAHGSHLACFDTWRFSRWIDKLTVDWIKASNEVEDTCK
eukprot:TRINITY_DN4784_c0_g4_i1.p1 TRINITY_DN4784_c0_g4~~TRINITY_DN4784_c0_g4_i1.p1  ORF type:complete len:415 (+),score=35.87 TRINITY_DN4784_c0_g4_i1:44-1288(+)